ncbi:S1C family serine protease [Methylobacterium gossipiicola]|uniref:Serine protease, S1-C subfamily, contains C-terminal PDZ domain n=1 Tax=Methylobacterium gossipiicola TaxID=582675 RepID=A0A1I2VZA5_9HYPH|nr:S1C family serine protease [Methylobacterium gossipiicola]SFG93667.1 serine protease, S1-C subfamily, contains C-terminal PDZ domain [Methylobacterium gossipiicola]
MATPGDWKIPASVQPRAGDYGFDLAQALTAIVALSTRVPDEAFSAETLGTERAGNGVVIGDDGLVLTIGYLVMEADTVWLTTHDGRSVPGHVVGYDAVTGFGLVQALGPLNLPALPLGRSGPVRVGDRAIVAGVGGRQRSVAVEIVARQEFAGYWEYVLDEALFTAPAHPQWGGAALIGAGGELLGIGSLQLQQGTAEGPRTINMIVPIDLLPPILDDLVTRGRADRPPRPWLGLYASDGDDAVVIMGLADDGPAEAADLRPGDVVTAVAGEPVADLAGFFRQVWALGEAGVRVPLTIRRDGQTIKLAVTSANRERFLVSPPLH